MGSAAEAQPFSVNVQPDINKPKPMSKIVSEDALAPSNYPTNKRENGIMRAKQVHAVRGFLNSSPSDGHVSMRRTGFIVCISSTSTIFLKVRSLLRAQDFADCGDAIRTCTLSRRPWT